MQPNQIWQATLGELQGQLSRANFETWLRNTQLTQWDGESATIGASNTFAVDQLRNKFAAQIQQALSTIIGHPVAVQFAVVTSEHPADRKSVV